VETKNSTMKSDTPLWQAHRQDLAAGGKNQKEEPKTRRGGHIFKTLHWMHAATRRPNVKWWAQISNMGWRAPLPPRWRRLCFMVGAPFKFSCIVSRQTTRLILTICQFYLQHLIHWRYEVSRILAKVTF